MNPAADPAPLALLAVIAGGGVGAALRYLLDTLLRERARVPAGVSTLLINTLGCLVAGIAGAGLVHTASDPAAQQPFAIAIAVCAGFTTFSTASLDAWNAARERDARRALALTLGQLLACGVAFTVANLATHLVVAGMR